MIINTGQRTDIPAFFSEWFANRLKEGFVCVRNPYNPHHVNKYILDPATVDLFAFCTKNPEPMFKYMENLKPYGQYWMVTITPYGREIEPNVPDKKDVLNSFRRLSDMTGSNSVCWRYDPVFISEKYSKEYHINAFAGMAERLNGYTDTVIISFIDIYKKVSENFPAVSRVSHTDRIELGKELIKIAGENKMKVRTCAEDRVLEPYGALVNGCQTAEVFEKAIGSRLSFPAGKNARESCECYLSNDIGAYDTCMHLCKYCYANKNSKIVYNNKRLCDVRSPFLLGGYSAGDIINVVNGKSWKNPQISIFDLL
ncbi:MAG: DUF1848 domain-containing protein [Clostridiales bacterium]|nr:DUF1848 domain-containing protein [Clostridiales bacterium]MBS5877322.1 DUF1848 domain-containing protein [Clostridiales bacterium]